MKHLYEEAKFLKSILPASYTCIATETCVKCSSPQGIRDTSGNEDEEHWDFIMKAIRQKFGDRFQEVYHNTCTFHISFEVYIKPETGFTGWQIARFVALILLLCSMAVCYVSLKTENQLISVKVVIVAAMFFIGIDSLCPDARFIHKQKSDGDINQKERGQEKT